MDPILQLEQLIASRALYPVVAVLLTLLMQVARKSPYTKPLMQKVPDGYRWLLPVLAGAAVGFISGFQKGYQLTGALIEAVMGLFGVSFTSMGVAAALKESPLPWEGGAGGKVLPPKSQTGSVPEESE